jgi:hypothetical protein
MMRNDDVPAWPSRVPPGVPGAGWVIGTVFALSVVVFTSWWWEGSHGAHAAPATAHHTSGASN